MKRTCCNWLFFSIITLNRIVIYGSLFLVLYLNVLTLENFPKPTGDGQTLLLLLPTLTSILFFPLVFRIEKAVTKLLEHTRSIITDCLLACLALLYLLGYVVVFAVFGSLFLQSDETKFVIVTNASFILTQHCLRCPNKPSKRRQCCATRRRTAQQPQPDEEQFVREVRRLQQMARSAPAPAPAPAPALNWQIYTQSDDVPYLYL